MQAQHLPTSIPPPSPSPATTPSFSPTKPKLPARAKTPHAIFSISTPSLIPSPTAPKVEENTTLDDDSVTAFWDYQFLFVSQRSETIEPITLKIVDGQVPNDFPLGTYFLTGPGLFKDDHGSTVHPLDGHGYLRSFTIGPPDAENNREVKFMARYVKTEAQVEECDHETGTWQFTHRGPFSVLRGGQRLGNTKVMKNVANTSVVWWGGKLLCLWEGGVPYEIESRSLNTIGKFHLIDCFDPTKEIKPDGSFDGRNIWDVAAKFLKPILEGVFKMPPRRLLSHYKIDASRKRLIVVSCNAEDMLLPTSHFTFYEYDLDFKLIQKQEFNILDHMMIHDWAFTENHYIIFANRIKLDIPGSMTAVCGLSPMITALSVNPSKATSPVYLLPRFSNESSDRRDWKVPIELDSQSWLLHCGNAFEHVDSNGNLNFSVHASTCSYRWFNFQKMFVGQRRIRTSDIRMNIYMSRSDGGVADLGKKSSYILPTDLRKIYIEYLGIFPKYLMGLSGADLEIVLAYKYNARASIICIAFNIKYTQTAWKRSNCCTQQRRTRFREKATELQEKVEHVRTEGSDEGDRGYDWQSGKLDPGFMNVKQGNKNVLPHLVQISIKVDPSGACEKCSIDPLSNWTKPADFPVINQAFSGAKNKYIYAATSSGYRQALPDFPFDTVVKVSTEDKSVFTWSAGRRRFIGEPIFVPKGEDGAEDDGYLIVVEYAVPIQKCFLVILDANRIGEADQLVARLEVPKQFNFPLGFHGFWAKHE
ncbi:unnamed protein product [Rhodiola kirilowii]